jgi:formylglycine-generating enzyme required for sulfatase activity
VTNAEYVRFVTETDRKPPRHWEGKIPPSKIETHPVVRVSWYDAEAYAQWAGKQLLTEQQWEKAARGIDGRLFPWGDNEPTAELGNFKQKVSNTTHVGRYSPQGDSFYGCVDMAGNVWEWTASLYQADKELRVLRGGSGSSEMDYLRCAYRYFNFPNNRSFDIGFRCFCNPS